MGDRAFVAATVARAGSDGARAALALAARSLAAASGVTLDEENLRLFEHQPAPAVAIEPPSESRPVLLGHCFEALLTDDQRHAGAHHTPPAVAARVVALVLDGRAHTGSVCDPAVGGGVFLLAAAEQLHRAGLCRDEVLDRLWGFDTDPLAVAVAETALHLWGGGAAGVARMIVGDFLDEAVTDHRPGRGWSVIVGNPPFQSQVAGTAVRNRRRAADLRRRFGAPAGGYVDTAGLFALAGVEHLAERGRLALVLPASLMASRDGSTVRRAVAGAAPIRSVWVPPRPLFGASVDVVVPVFERGDTPRAVDVLAGGVDDGRVAAPVRYPGPDWSVLLAAAEGVPDVELEDGRSVGDRADVTAGFRQHFYGLAGAVHEGGAGPGRPVLTVGLVDPLSSHWGRRTTRLAGVEYVAPVIGPDAVADGEVAAWIAARRRPKLLVATQTRVIEAVADPDGSAVPSTPLISVEPHDPEADLWRLAAVLCAPPLTAWLHHRGAGGGLSRGRIRPTAALVLGALPLPEDGPAWDRGAALARRASTGGDATVRRQALLELGAVMTEAYGADPGVTSWWTERLPAAVACGDGR